MPGQQGTSQDQSIDPGIDQRLQTRTIAETLSSIEECSALYKLVSDADLGYVLRRSGLHTLLAPRNNAFTGSAVEDAEELLSRHLLPGGIESFDLRRCKSVKNEAGEMLPAQPDGASFRIGKALIVKSDVPSTNGVIHIMDALVAK